MTQNRHSAGARRRLFHTQYPMIETYRAAFRDRLSEALKIPERTDKANVLAPRVYRATNGASVSIPV
jgi:hypothetical protein